MEIWKTILCIVKSQIWLRAKHFEVSLERKSQLSNMADILNSQNLIWLEMWASIKLCYSEMYLIIMDFYLFPAF